VVSRVRFPTILHSEHTDGRPVVTPTRIDALHVKISHTSAEWHRFLLEGAHHNSGSWRRDNMTRSRTACGKAIGSYYAVREESYAGDLCKDGCFTPLELVTAAEQRAAEQRQRDLDNEKWQADKDEMARQIEKHRAESKQRLADQAELEQRRTGEQPPLPKPKPDDGG
jgi:hypothetical protein